jgi:hypothetical protein
MTVPAGWTTVVYDTAPLEGERGGGGAATDAGGNQVLPSRLVGPTPAVLPVGMDLAGRPFSEPALLQIGAAFEAGTRHRRPPPDFGPIQGEL